ncbi:MAG: glycosyltransferase family 2 protein [Thermoproteota archaeon]
MIVEGCFFPWLALFDCKNFISKFKKPFEIKDSVYIDYTIVVPLFKNPDYLKNLDYLRRFKEKVIIATLKEDDPRMTGFLASLKAEGFRILEVEETGGIDLKYYLIKRVVGTQIYDILRRKSVELVKTKYLCFLDGDTVPEDDIGKVCAVMEENSLDLVSVKVVPSNSRNFIEKMQEVEYKIAMLSRHYFPWLTSGACTIGKTTILREIMKRHSLFFWGGDIEIGVLARKMKKKIGHVNFKAYTVTPSSFRKWFKQRTGWFCGTFRLSVINSDHHILQAPLYLIYSCGLVFLLWPFKIVFSITHWHILPYIILFYILLTFLANWQVRSKYMIMFPFYAVIQVLIMPILGILKYLHIVLKYRLNGRFMV